MKTLFFAACVVLISTLSTHVSVADDGTFSQSVRWKSVAGGNRLVSPEKSSMDAFDVRLGDGKLGTHTVDDDGLRIEITGQPQNTWDAAFGVPTTSDVKAGDVLVVGFEFRGEASDGTGGAVAEFVFERGGEPYTKSVQYLAETESATQWQTVWVRFEKQGRLQGRRSGLQLSVGLPKTNIGSPKFCGLELRSRLRRQSAA